MGIVACNPIFHTDSHSLRFIGGIGFIVTHTAIVRLLLHTFFLCILNTAACTQSMLLYLDATIY